MSQNDNDHDNDLSATATDISAPDDVEGTTEASDADFADEPELQPAKRGKSGSIVSWLALLLATTALAGAALIYLSGGAKDGASEQVQTEIESLQATVRASRDSLTALERNVASLSAQDSSSSADLESLDRQWRERLRQFESVPGRIAGVEATMSALQGVSTGARDAWLLAEAEYYMQIANAQLQLAGNPHLATLALTLADERLLQLADPGLVQVRRALSGELRALDGVQKPDTEGITLALASLAGAVDSLPLRNDRVVATAPAGSVDPELTGADRALASLKKTLSDVVSVRRTDEAVKPMIAPEAQYFLRANLQLQFQSARLAVLQGEEAVFEQSLDDASAWLEKHYDTGNAAVQNAQQRVVDLRGSAFAVSKPDISESLRLLRQFNALSTMESESDSEAGSQSDTESQPTQPVEDPQPAEPESEPQQ